MSTPKLSERLRAIRDLAQPLTRQGEDYIWRPCKKIVDQVDALLLAISLEAQVQGSSGQEGEGRGLTEREINHIQKFSLDFCDKYATTFSSHDRVAIIIHLREAIAKFIGDHGYLSQQGRPDLPSGEPMAWMTANELGCTTSKMKQEMRELAGDAFADKFSIPLYRSAPEVDVEATLDALYSAQRDLYDWRRQAIAMRGESEDAVGRTLENMIPTKHGIEVTEGVIRKVQDAISRLLSGPSGSGEEKPVKG